MLLAAGRGERMRPLTDHTPKPLLQVRGRPLLWYPLQALALAGVSSAVINTGWLGDQIEPALGSVFTPTVAGVGMTPAATVQLRYSHEGRGPGEALETAGGIVRALPLLAEVFWVAAGDVFAPDFAFSMSDFERFKASPHLAHIWLVPNPAHNPRGDFGLSAGGMALNQAPQQFTYSTVGLYRPTLFAGTPAGHKAALAPLLRTAMQSGRVSAALYSGAWTDVGTPERLAALNAPQAAP